jgi:hypothetical protein
MKTSFIKTELMSGFLQQISRHVKTWPSPLGLQETIQQDTHGNEENLLVNACIARATTMLDDNYCDCSDCSIDESPCRMDCMEDEQCTGCRQAEEEHLATIEEIDYAQGRYSKR